MLTNKTKAIGYLLEILNITATTLAKAIHIDRTGVSKWISGARPFGANSPHYEAVIAFIIDANKIQGQQTLEKFFSNIYPDMAQRHESLRTCIDKFLLQTDIPLNVYNLVAEAQGCAYYCNMPVYINASGREAAFGAILSLIEQSETQEELFLFDNEQFEWLTEDDDKLSAAIERLRQILEKGHIVNCISNSYYNDSYKKFSTYSYVLYSYKNFTEYHFTAMMNPKTTMTIYLLRDRATVMGYNLNKDTGEIYTSIMRDPYSVKSNEKLLRAMMQDCAKTHAAYSLDERIIIFDAMNRVHNINEVSYIFTPHLSFITMSEELLAEVLRINGVCGTIADMLMNLRKVHYESFYNKCLSAPIRHFGHYNQIINIIQQERIYYEELSVIAGRDIYMGNSHIRRHLLDTSKVLLTSDNFSMALMTMSLSKHQDYSCKVKRNLYYTACQRIFKFIGEPNVVNTIVSIFDKEWNNNIPNEYKDNKCVAQKLIDIAERS